ncbi:hypothetical protein ACJMK2_022502 [Sinanodonta woodiana]|uniref:Uncharacterized protein n=1 Tax=Sinanodonta woodiana TaxID=1069815 RepID=A0ABD3TKJ7_SINWO
MTSALLLISVFLIVSSNYIDKTNGDATINNVPCRENHRCNNYGSAYAWCYTDSHDNWDYCCKTPCEYDDQDALRCKSGRYDKFCGNPGNKTALLEDCVGWSPCGHYGYEFYWCYTDNDSKAWGYCCHPNATCSSRIGYSGNVCNIGFYHESGGYWKPCKPT